MDGVCIYARGVFVDRVENEKNFGGVWGGHEKKSAFFLFSGVCIIAS